MLKNARRKGSRCERFILDLFEQWGWTGRKQFMSGGARDAAPGERHDLKLNAPDGYPLYVEVKARRSGIATFDRWLDGAHMVVLKPDNERPMFLLTEDTMARFCRMATAAQEELRRAEEAARKVA